MFDVFSVGKNFFIQIERVQNPDLHSRYVAHKMTVDKANSTGTKTERYLWHGTSQTSVDNIISNGFNRSYCGKNGMCFSKSLLLLFQNKKVCIYIK